MIKKIPESVKNENTGSPDERKEEVSFFSFMNDNYELSMFVLPKKKPANDLLDKNEMRILLELMYERDFYEINSIIKKRYKASCPVCG